MSEMVEMGYIGFSENLFLVGKHGFPDLEMVSRNFLYQRFVKIKKEVGIPIGYVMYALKHTGMVELKRSGADWLEVRNQAGHKSLDQTIEYTQALMGNGSELIRERGPKI